MKVELLKNIIKEAVREAVNEEIKSILLEAVSIASKESTPETQPQSIPEVKAVRTDSKVDPAIMEMINMTKNTMTQQDYKSIINADSSMIPRPSFQTNNIAEGFNPGPQPGIDISKLDFVKNAAAIFNKSVELSKR